ncbi:DUF443 family protein [Pseudogracilibacillus auburnensis]|uniref:DUF443 family protein n=1 Tax=Pseudogracilibacillus auburnensis TaxID=1494959 RepID=UPI0027D9E539|nr:DUF443 family protein [Pseudogracilibacillus auburnensis]
MGECDNLMKCKVQGVYMNPRYRALSIGEEKYILDMGKSFWKILFPFSFWILPNTAYKVNDHEIIKKMIAPEVKPKTTAGNGLLAGGIGIVLANLLQPLVNYFDVESTPLVNAIIVGIVFFITLSVFYYINIRSKKKLTYVIDLHQYSMRRLWIRPQSYKHFFFILFTYLFLIVFIVITWGGFIQIAANTVILLIGMMILSFLLFISILTVGVGDTTVRFKDDKKEAV